MSKAPRVIEPRQFSSGDVHIGAPRASAPDATKMDRPVAPGRPWLPRELKHFWISQELRDYIFDRYGEDEVGKVEYLMALVAHFDGAEVTVDASPIGQDLVERIGRSVTRLPAEDNPDVSVIIPVYNNLIYTLTSVLSIVENASRYSYEILIGDDRSTDATEAIIPRLGRAVRHVRHASNRGFLANSNATAKAANGRVLVFLNNDTVTLPSWLDNLVEIFGQPNVGLAGSKLLNGNGSLQEAGGICWNDGSAWNFGRHQEARAPQFNYVKDVDYCSGASIALTKALWDELEGFDRIFTPAYYEDVDLAFRVRATGRRCVYHPHSEVIHHEGRSNGTDTAVGVKANQLLNQQKLIARWAHVLRREHFPNGQEQFVARDRTRNKPHILVIDHYVPQWDRDAGSRAIFHTMVFFQSRGFQITFWPDNLHYDAVYVRALQALGIEVIYSERYRDRLGRWLSENKGWVKYIISSRPHITDRYIDRIRSATDCPIIYYGVDLHWKRLSRQYDISGEARLLAEIAATKQLEETIFERVDSIAYLSKEERDEVAATLRIAKPVVEVPAWCFDNGELDAAAARLATVGQRDRHHLLFVGGFAHPPNVDGLAWFARSVMPALLRQDSRFRLTVVGSNVPDAIMRLASQNVSILGHLSDEDLLELYRVCGMAVAPLRFGAGVKGKVIEAFARGLPVVTTPTGVQGVPDADSVAFVCNGAAEFVSAVVTAAVDQRKSAQKAAAALAFVRRRYSHKAFARAFAPIVPELLGPN